MVHFSFGSKKGIFLLLIVLTLSFMFTSCRGKQVEPEIPEEKPPIVTSDSADEPEINVVEDDIPIIEEDNTPSEESGGERMISMAQKALNDVKFDYNKYILTSTARSTLTENARFLSENQDIRISIEGHCDERGSNEYNLALGEKRAVSTKSFLESLGVSASRLNTVSYGEEQPLDMGHDEVAWSENRRAHFQVR